MEVPRLWDDLRVMNSQASTGSRRIPLRKRLGQHHLIDGETCIPLVRFLNPAGCLVVEIGPGGGVLTEKLAATARRVVAVEIDTAWGLALGQRVDLDRAQVIIGDALQIEWGRLAQGTLVAGNLPFNIGTVLIERVLRQWRTVPKAAFLVQKEVADRLLAGPGNAGYGALSVITAARSRAVHLGVVRRGSFRPPPGVDGAFVGLELKSPVLAEEEMGGFVATVHLAFAQRRKQLRNALGAGWGRDESDRSLAAAGIDARRRAEELSLPEFVRLQQAHRKAGEQ